MSYRDTLDRLAEIIEPAVRLAAETGEAQSVDVTSPFTGDSDHRGLALVQRAIDRAVRGTALDGYAAMFPRGLAAVIRVPERVA